MLTLIDMLREREREIKLKVDHEKLILTNNSILHVDYMQNVLKFLSEWK